MLLTCHLEDEMDVVKEVDGQGDKELLSSFRSSLGLSVRFESFEGKYYS